MLIENTDKDINRMKILANENYDCEAKIATTNGVFDLLHVGHIRFLQAIKNIADVLVVCVNSDESVRRLKGEGRPIIPLAERMEILDALRCVDYVIPFEEDTPCEILAKIKPDIHVKDSSYADKNIPEIQVVKNDGGIVVYLDKLCDHSTTDIINTILFSEELKSFGKVGAK